MYANEPWEKAIDLDYFHSFGTKFSPLIIFPPHMYIYSYGLSIVCHSIITVSKGCIYGEGPMWLKTQSYFGSCRWFFVVFESSQSTIRETLCVCCLKEEANGLQVSYNIPFHNGCAMKACSTRGNGIFDRPSSNRRSFFSHRAKQKFQSQSSL